MVHSFWGRVRGVEVEVEIGVVAAPSVQRPASRSVPGKRPENLSENAVRDASRGHSQRRTASIATSSSWRAGPTRRTRRATRSRKVCRCSRSSATEWRSTAVSRSTPGVEVLVAALDEPVGVEQDDAAARQVDRLRAPVDDPRRRRPATRCRCQREGHAVRRHAAAAAGARRPARRRCRVAPSKAEQDQRDQRLLAGQLQHPVQSRRPRLAGQGRPRPGPGPPPAGARRSRPRRRRGP